MNPEEVQKRDLAFVNALGREKCTLCGVGMPENLFRMVIYKCDNLQGSARHYCSVDCYSKDNTFVRCNECGKQSAGATLFKDRAFELVYQTVVGGIVIAKYCCSVKCMVITKMRIEDANAIVYVRTADNHIIYPLCKNCGSDSVDVGDDANNANNSSAPNTEPITENISEGVQQISAETKLMKCSTCGTYYCNEICQGEHWAVHRKVCKTLKYLNTGKV